MSNLASAAAVKKAISIPFRIKRSSTDLLKALSKTVQQDPNGPLYSLVDDSLLTPLSPFDTKRCQMAKASGIKAARFMIQKYPQAFMYDECDPHISSFFPPKEFTEEEIKYPSEDLIHSLMSWGKFKQAYDTYLKCKDQNIQVSDNCLLVLLDLLSINNSLDLKEKTPLLEEWHVKAGIREAESRVKFTHTNAWNKNSEAESLFNDLKVKPAEAYCSLIKGMAKYHEIEGATNLYNEMKTNKLVPDLNTINALLKLIVNMTEATYQKKTELMMEKLNEIKNYGILPNLKTFNICLDIVRSFGLNQKSIPLALDILKEMESLNIEPSLASYGHLLHIFYPNREIGSKTGILGQVIDKVEKLASQPNGLEWKDINDCIFFEVAMSRCQSGPQTNLPYVKRLHAILTKDNNIKFLNDSHLYNKYFDNYLLALMKFDVPENVIKEWRNTIPYVFNGNTRVFERMLEYVYNYKCFEFVPEIWSNIVNFRPKYLSEFCSDMVKSILKTMILYEEKDEKLIKQYSDIAEAIIKQYPYLATVAENEQTEQFQREYSWDSKMLSNFFVIVLNGKKVELAWTEFEKYVKNQGKVMGELDEKCIIQLFDAFLDKNQIDRAFEVLNLAVELKLPCLKDLIKKSMNSNSINQEKKETLNQIKTKLAL